MNRKRKLAKQQLNEEGLADDASTPEASEIKRRRTKTKRFANCSAKVCLVRRLFLALMTQRGRRQSRESAGRNGERNKAEEAANELESEASHLFRL